MAGHGPPARRTCRSDPGCPVDALADEVGVPGVAGVLADHVAVDATQRDLAGRERAGGVEVPAAAVDPRHLDLALPRGPGLRGTDVTGELEAPVGAVRVGGRVVDGRGLLAD